MVSPNQTSHATAIAFQPRDRPNEPRARDAYGDGRVVSAMTRRASAPPRTRPRAQRRRGPCLWRRANRQRRADSHLGSHPSHSQQGDGSGTGFRLSGSWEVGGEMPPDLVDRRGRQCPRTSRKSSRSLRTVDQDGPHVQGAKQRKSVDLSHAESSTHVDACLVRSAQGGLDVVDLLLDAGDELRLVSAVDRQDLVPGSDLLHAPL